jgi:hypothetical protein
MALLNATELLDIQSGNASNEKRFSQLGLVDIAKDSGLSIDYISPSDRARMQTLGSQRNLQLPVIKDQTVVVNQTPGFSFIPSNLLESDEYTFTAVDVFSGFRHYPAQYAENSIDEAWAKQQKMKNVLYAMGQTVESLIDTTLETRKTQLLNNTLQVSQGEGTFTFNAGTDTLEVNKAAVKDTMFFNLQHLAESNELPGDYRIVNNRGGLSEVRAQMIQNGANNAINKASTGFPEESRMYETGTISGGSDIFNGWFLRDGAVGLIENFPYDFRAGTQFAGKQWSVTPTELPFLRMRANVYVNNEATEATALISGGSSNLEMTHFQEMAIWNRFFIPYRYNSDLTTRVNDVIKIKGLTT